MQTDNKLYILSNGRVAALNKNTGDIIWEVRLKEYVNVSAGYTLGQIMLEDNKLLVSIAGIVLCLNAGDGSLVWKNELKGWGYSFVSMAGAPHATIAEANNATTAAVVTGTIATTAT